MGNQRETHAEGSAHPCCAGSCCCGDDDAGRLDMAAAPTQDDVRNVVRNAYTAVARKSDAGDVSSACCAESAGGVELLTIHSGKLGYSDADIESVPEGANMGLGCGNPTAIAALQPGETVLDLGSGGGFDCFLAAGRVGAEGRVIGVDMTPEMVSKARKNAEQGGYANVEFRLGEIEHLPVADSSVDVIVSNCVINLSPDKRAVYREAFRVLRPGGRLAISDVVTTAPLPEELRSDPALLAGCVAGAMQVDELEAILHEAGYADIRIEPKAESREFIRQWAPGRRIEDYVASANIEATKP